MKYQKINQYYDIVEESIGYSLVIINGHAASEHLVLRKIHAVQILVLLGIPLKDEDRFLMVG